MKMTDLNFKNGETYLCTETANESWFTKGKYYMCEGGYMKDDMNDAWGWDFTQEEPDGDFCFDVNPKRVRTKIDMRNPQGNVCVAKNLAYIEAVKADLPTSVIGFLSTLPFLYFDDNRYLTGGDSYDNFRSCDSTEVTFEYEYKLEFTITPKTKQQALRTKLNKNILELEAQLVQARIELDKL
jgi:hypothetical protein